MFIVPSKRMDAFKQEMICARNLFKSVYVGREFVPSVCSIKQRMRAPSLRNCGQPISTKLTFDFFP